MTQTAYSQALYGARVLLQALPLGVALLGLGATAQAAEIDTSMLDGGSAHVFFHDDGCTAAMRAEMPADAYVLAQKLGDDTGTQSNVQHIGRYYVASAIQDDMSGHQMLDLATDGKKVWTRLLTHGKATFYGNPSPAVQHLLSVKY